MAGKNLKVLSGLIAVSIFVLLVFYVPQFFEESAPLACFDGGTCLHEEYLGDVISYIPAFIVGGFILGVLASYFYFERRIEVPLPSKDRRESVLALLPPTERKVVLAIAEKDGETLQSEVSRLEGVGKVKAHRVIDKLIRRGVLEKRQVGKTNMLKIRKDILEALNP